MTLLYPNLYYNEVCYIVTTLYIYIYVFQYSDLLLQWQSWFHLYPCIIKCCSHFCHANPFIWAHVLLCLEPAHTGSFRIQWILLFTCDNYTYFILNSEINAYQQQIKVMSITSEMIYLYCSIFWITSDFSIHLMQHTSKVQTPITFLFVNKNIKCG